MEIKPEMIELGEVTRWLSGGTPSRSIAEYWVGDIPWISAFTLKTIEVSTSDQCVTAEAVASGSKMAPIDSTLLLVRGSALHNEIRAGIVRKPVCFNQDVKALIPAKTVHPKYLTYSILGRENELLKLVSSAGNTAGVLDTKLVQSFKIWLPKYDEQRAIATALSDVDALLDGLDRLIAKKRDLKQAAMQQLLNGDTRLPGFEGKWEVKRLEEIADADPENLTCSTSPNYTFNYIALEDVNRGRLENYSEVVFSSAPSRARRKLRCGDIMVATVRPNLKAHLLFNKFGGEWVCSTGFCVIRSKKNISDSEFLIQHFFSHLINNQIEALIAGSNYPAISNNDVRALEIPLPPHEEQVAISAVLSDMDAEIAALEQRRNKTHDLKQAMMQELLTGRTRLVTPAEQEQNVE